jgi:hypothetical protein
MVEGCGKQFRGPASMGGLKGNDLDFRHFGSFLLMDESI